MKIISNLIEAHIFRIRNNKLEFLLLKRGKGEIYPDVWQMVSGKVENGETAYDAALREIEEETSLIPEKFWVVPTLSSFYNHITDEACLVPVFVAKVSKMQSVKISDEHSEYKWVSKKKAKQMLAWEAQHKSVNTIYKYFMKRMEFLNLVEIKI